MTVSPLLACVLIWLAMELAAAAYQGWRVWRMGAGAHNRREI